MPYDLPQKQIPSEIVIPDGWKEIHCQGQCCFYWTAKANPAYKAACDFCGHKLNGINLCKLKKTVVVSGVKGNYICGGACWGKYMAQYDWERCPCGICIQWHMYIEALKGKGDTAAIEFAPVDWPESSATSVTGTPMYVREVESNRDSTSISEKLANDVLLAVASQGTSMETMAATLSRNRDSISSLEKQTTETLAAVASQGTFMETMAATLSRNGDNISSLEKQTTEILAAVASQGTFMEPMAAVLSQQQEALQGQSNIILKLFAQMEKTPTKEDIKDFVTKADIEESIHDLHEKTDLLLGYCKKIDSKLTNLGAKSPPTSVDFDDLPTGWTATSSPLEAQ